jgi:hypothetical protein
LTVALMCFIDARVVSRSLDHSSPSGDSRILIVSHNSLVRLFPSNSFTMRVSQSVDALIHGNRPSAQDCILFSRPELSLAQTAWEFTSISFASCHVISSIFTTVSILLYPRAKCHVSCPVRYALDCSVWRISPDVSNTRRNGDVFVSPMSRLIH